MALGYPGSHPVSVDLRELLEEIGPADAVVGGIDQIGAEHWSLLGAYWLAAGYDSPALIQLAALTASDVHEARALMPTVLAELGYPVISEAELVSRCQRMLDVVQRDLDATGYGEYRMHPVNAYPPEALSPGMYAALPNGYFWSGGSEGMRPRHTDLELLAAAATSVRDTLIEVLQVNWPGCPADAGYPMAPGIIDPYRAPVRRRGLTLWWWCQPGDHFAAPIGKLATAWHRR
jgi:hypothetical protein